MESIKTNHAKLSQDEDTLGPLNPMYAMRDVPLNNRCSNPNHPCAVHRPWVGRTPPATPPGRSAPLLKSPLAAEDAKEKSSHSSEPKRHRGIAAPASAVDPVMETFGRPRAHSLSRDERHMSLPEWDEGDEDEDAMPDSLGMEDRRRAVSMSAAENLRQHRSSAPKVFSFRKRCRDCNLAPAFAMKGESPSFCRAHQMADMVNVLMDHCSSPGCHRMATYGFHGEGRQRCFSHMEKGMVHVLGAAMEKETVAARSPGM